MTVAKSILFWRMVTFSVGQVYSLMMPCTLSLDSNQEKQARVETNQLGAQLGHSYFKSCCMGLTDLNFVLGVKKMKIT